MAVTRHSRAIFSHQFFFFIFFISFRNNEWNLVYLHRTRTSPYMSFYIKMKFCDNRSFQVNRVDHQYLKTAAKGTQQMFINNVRYI